MTYRFAVAGTALAAWMLLGGCASSAPKDADAANPPVAESAESASAPQKLERPAPTASEIESPLTSGGAGALPVIAEAQDTAAPRPAQPDVPPARPGTSPVVEEVITMPTEDLHGGAFPGVGAVPKANGNGKASDGVTKRISDIEAQLNELRNTASKSTAGPAGPDLAAFNAVQARLDELSAKVAAVESKPAPSGIDPARVEQIEAQVDALATALAARERAPGDKPAQPAQPDNFATKLHDLEGKIADIDASLEQGEAKKADSGVAYEELAARLQAMQRQLDELEARPAAQSEEQPRGSADSAKLQRRIDELTAQVAAIRDEQASQPAPAPDSALDARFDKIEQQIGGIQMAMNAPKDAPADLAMVDERFGALESQLNALRGELEKQSAALAARPAAVTGVDGPVASVAPPSSGEYRLGAGDKVEFQSFNDEKLSREELVVRFDGQLSLPLIPDVAVANLTRAEAEERIREEYRSVFRDPQVALIVRDAASKSYAIVGDVEKPGVYPFTTNTKLIEAISLAGGLRRRSSSSSVGGFVGVTGQLTKAFIVRTVNGQREVLQFDLRGLGTPGVHDSEVPVQYGDLIYIPEGVNLVYLLGESRNPVIVELTEGMKLLQLLALSGGFDSSTARLSGVVLMRQVDGDNTQVMKMNVREMLRTGRDVLLVPGDIVYIPRKRLIALQEFVSRFTGSISPVLDLYTSAVDAYYAKDLQQSLIEEGPSNSTLQVLNNLEDFGQSTSNIVDLFRRP